MLIVQFLRITKDEYTEKQYEMIAKYKYSSHYGGYSFIKPSIEDTITVNGYRGEVTNVHIDYNDDAIDIFGRFDKID